MAKRRNYKTKAKGKTIVLGLTCALLGLTTAGLIAKVTNDEYGWADNIKAQIVARDYTIFVNNEEVKVESFHEDENIYCYVVDLQVGDELVTQYQDDILTLGESEETSFVATIEGEHKVYINEEYQVCVVAPVVEAE
jgi:hypothetical protein